MFDLAELYVFLWLIYLVLSFIIFKKDSRWINRIFVLMTLNLSFESLINAWFTIHKNNFQGKLIFVILSGLDIIFYFNMLIFIILLTDNENWFNRLWKKIAISIPMIIAIYIYEILIVDPLQFAKAVSGKYLFENIYNGYIYNSYFYLYYAAIGIISICLVFRWYRKESVKRKKRQALIVFISMISALVMGILLDNYIEFFTETHVDPLMVIITVIPCLAVAYSMKKYRMMNVDPKNMAMEIAQLMSEGIIVINHEGIVQYANNGIGTMLGFKNKDMVDKHISYIIEKNNEELKLKDINSEEIQIKTRDNKIIPVLFSSTIGYDEFDEILSIVLIFKNISEIKKIQNEIVEINNDLEKRVEERTNKLNETNEKLNSEILRRIDIEKDIAYIADHDYLTGLPNRRYLMNKFNEMVKLDGNLAIVYMDIDMFKNINDSLGHEIGDRVLIEVGNRLNMIIKKPNIIARIGGDEFLILINDFQNREGLSKILDEILQLFNESFELEREKMIISSSLGIAIYPEDGKDFGTLMKNADISLYSAKADGKARYKICNEDLKQQIKEEYKLINYLKNALEMEEIAAYYQPKVNQCTGKIVGFEALARWNNSEYGFISPVKFIPIAEKTGLIIDIGEYMLKTACEKMKGWVELGHTEWVMS
ncbi:MAG: diguanylate cyclase domain-containing protein, partial [Clostridiaceae bacterium]